MTAECPIVDKIEHDLALHKLRLNRLRVALKFIRDHANSAAETKLYAASALAADEMML